MQVSCWNISGNTFHFGRHGLGQEETGVSMPSDSLFAALVARLARKAGPAAVERWMEPFLHGTPPFILTSTFPFAGTVRFFPTPANVLAHEVKGVRPKDLKQVVYVSAGLFQKLLQGQRLGDLYPRALKLQGGRVLAEPGEADALPAALRPDGEALWSVDRQARVTLGRNPQNSNIFFTGRVAFAAGCGLWFGLRWFTPEAAWQQQLQALLADLADAGLGADRTTGFGACQITPSGVLNLPDPEQQTWVSLSRYLPAQDEMAALRHAQAVYQIHPVGGWLDSPVSAGFRRRSVNLLAEGSVFGPLAKPAPGRVADVRPSYPGNPDPLGHAVYRSGLAFGVGMQVDAVGIQGGRP